MKLLEKLTDEEVDEMILETDVDDTQCSEQIVDVPVPQIAQRIVEVVAAFHGSESQSESLYRSSTCQDTRTQSGGEDRQRFKQQVANAQDAKSVSRHDPAVNRRTSRKLSGGQAVRDHQEHRAQQKISLVSKQGRTRSSASTSDKLAVVSSVIQSPDPQDSAEYEAWSRQRSDRQRSISLTSTSRFLRNSISTTRSMCQRRYKRKVPTAQTVHREQ